MSSGTKSLRQAAKTLPPLRKLVEERDHLAAALAEARQRIVELEQKARIAEEPVSDAVQLWPPGHFYSPVPSVDDIARFDAGIERACAATGLPGIDLNVEVQLDTIRKMAGLYAPDALPETKQAGRRYYCENEFFSYADAVALQGMLRLAQPKRLVEVGSGFSSALILDTRDAFLPHRTHCTFVEPNPDRLELLFTDADRESDDIIVSLVQDVSMSVFESLDDGDVLFIDSSHVSKLASDVNMFVFDVLPRLKPGVLVHVHDVFYPFEYPREWVHQGRAWTEGYLVRAFLEFNDAFEVVLFNSYLRAFHRAEVASAMPLWDNNHGGSLWLRRRPARAG
ncbi:MAG: class I SAM-dependent methyltransferase [Acidimicrobiales bacterium]|jgi:predicted O-methyltransferase YrrM